MKSHALDSLLKIEDNLCISIILPINPADKAANYNAAKSALTEAKELLTQKVLNEEARRVLDRKLENALKQLPEKKELGLGIFISQSCKEIISFPFEVKRKVIVHENFELRDVIYLHQLAEPYFVLNLTASGVQLYRALMDDLEEIRDGNFPIEYKDEFEYEHAARASGTSRSLKGFEKDKSQISQIRLKTVWRQTNVFLKTYLRSDTKLIIAGSRKLISAFLTVTIFESNIFAQVPGSYTARNFTTFCGKCWQTFIRSQRLAMNKKIKSLAEKNNGHLAEGLIDVWNAVVQGKGKLLMVEKDFRKFVFQKDEEIRFSDKPNQKDYKINPDAVDDLLELVKQKHGIVVFTDNDDLKQYGHIALELRY